MCEEEVRLNRRLAPSLYLGLRALVPDRDGPLGWRLTDDARDPQAREYAVAMRRFDERHTLASLLDADCARREDLEASGAALRASTSPRPSRWTPRGGRRGWRGQWRRTSTRWRLSLAHP